VTHPGGGAGGADASALQTGLGMETWGFGFQASYANRIADDFTIASGTWQVTGIRFYGYQTGSDTSPTFTSLNLRIWDGPPNDPASHVVWGDTTTDRLGSASFSNIYRVPDTSLDDTSRPVMALDAIVSVTLPAGNYWLDWQADGPPWYPGPWAPPITILGQTTTGNALQFADGAWGPAMDSETSNQQGFPFEVMIVPEPGSTAWVAGFGLCAFAGLRAIRSIHRRS